MFLFFLIFAWVDQMNKIIWRAKLPVFLEKGIFPKRNYQNSSFRQHNGLSTILLQIE